MTPARILKAFARMTATKHHQPPPATVTDDPAQLHKLLSEFPTVLLGTFERRGELPSLRARPMSVARLDEDCTLYFISPVETEKVEEAEASGIAHAFGQSKTQFFSLRGTIELTQDRALLAELWGKANDVWLDGPDDPRASVLILHPEVAELWDVSGAKGLKFLFDAAKALATGVKLHASDREQHVKVRVDG
jgi:general stress protein 26